MKKIIFIAAIVLFFSGCMPMTEEEKYLFEHGHYEEQVIKQASFDHNCPILKTSIYWNNAPNYKVNACGKNYKYAFREGSYIDITRGNY